MIRKKIKWPVTSHRQLSGHQLLTGIREWLNPQIKQREYDQTALKNFQPRQATNLLQRRLWSE